MTLIFYEISFCVLYVQGGWAVSLWVWVEFLSKILGLIAARGIGFILQSNTEQQLSRWRGGVEERIILMIQSAADILGKVHKWGWGGGCILYIIFDLVLEAKIAVPAVSPHLTLYIFCWNSYFGLQYQFKNDI